MVRIDATITAAAPKKATLAAQAPEPGLGGRFMLPDSTEHPCRVRDLTIDGAIFATPSPPPTGLPIVAYIETIGRVVGISKGPADGGFRIEFTLEGQRRERFASRLQSAGSEPKTGDGVPRRSERFRLANSLSQLGLPDGRVYACEVLDISLTGAAIKTEIMPKLGTYIVLGKTRGRIVRYTENGIAVEFVSPLDRASLVEQIR